MPAYEVFLYESGLPAAPNPQAASNNPVRYGLSRGRAAFLPDTEQEERAMGIAERRLNRREALMASGLVGAGGLAVLVAGCGTGSAQGATSASAGLEGTWHIDVSLDDGTKHQGLILCAGDGGVGVSATLAADSFANGFGVWTRLGSQYLITFEALVIVSGTFGGSLRVRAVPTIDQAGDQLTAQVKFDVQQPGASTFTTGGGATWIGRRIKPLAL